MKIAILHGGNSAESEISTRNALCVENALRERGHATQLTAFTPEDFWGLRAEKPDLVFIAVQGPGHGDGTSQSLCEFLSLPYTGTLATDAAVINHKTLCKKIAAYHGIPTPSFGVLKKQDWERGGSSALLTTVAQEAGFPLVAKAVGQGGSYGLAYVLSAGESDKIDNLFHYGDELLLEEFVPGDFITVSVLEGEETLVLPPLGAVGEAEYDDPLQLFNRPYQIVPAPLSQKEWDELQTLTLRIYRLFNCRGYARIDYMLNTDRVPQFIEVNAVPGLNAKSFFPRAAALAGIDLPELCEMVAQSALKPPRIFSPA